jgi:hypothetical protein
MAFGAFQASLNPLIHYELFYNGFYVQYFHIQLLGCNTKETDKLKVDNSWLAHISKYNNINDVESLASAVAQGNVVRAICISKGKAHF